jgi:hypothetical protein
VVTFAVPAKLNMELVAELFPIPPATMFGVESEMFVVTLYIAAAAGSTDPSESALGIEVTTAQTKTAIIERTVQVKIEHAIKPPGEVRFSSSKSEQCSISKIVSSADSCGGGFPASRSTIPYTTSAFETSERKRHLLLKHTVFVGHGR